MSNNEISNHKIFFKSFKKMNVCFRFIIISLFLLNFNVIFWKFATYKIPQNPLYLMDKKTIPKIILTHNQFTKKYHRKKQLCASQSCNNSFCKRNDNISYYKEHQPIINNREWASTVRVSNHRTQNNASVIDKGSGMLISDVNDNYYILTAAHIFQNGVGKIIVDFTENIQISPNLLWKDEKGDVALLALHKNDKNKCQHISPKQFAKTAPTAGQLVYIKGFGPRGIPKSYSGNLVGYVQASEFAAFDTLKIDCPVQQGDSGGPVCNTNNEIVGLVWGTDGKFSYAVGYQQIIVIIKAHSPAFFTTDENSGNITKNSNIPLNYNQPISQEISSLKFEYKRLKKQISNIYIVLATCVISVLIIYFRLFKYHKTFNIK